MKRYREFYREAKGDLPHIYCDMDGVLVDFVRGANKVTGKDWSGVRQDQDWAAIKAYKPFWSTLPWKSDGKRLWSFISKYKPSILSATVKNNTDPNATPGKQKWLQKNLSLTDSKRINIVLRSQKQGYAMRGRNFEREPAVLIDDYPKNIREWTAKGGIGILHTTTSSTISQLRKLGY
tara:strand:+ start:2034 stop:2567 length:534 start_codon:yes stop_codon:yes gene_type:complete